MGTTPRTGNQYSIHHGDFSAVVCELGSKLRRFDYGGKEVFCSYGPDDLTPTCCGYILAPWPNRIKDGEYDFNCKHYCAPVNEYHPEPRNNANHGYAYQYMWKLESLPEPRRLSVRRHRHRHVRAERQGHDRHGHCPQ